MFLSDFEKILSTYIYTKTYLFIYNILFVEAYVLKKNFKESLIYLLIARVARMLPGLQEYSNEKLRPWNAKGN